MLIMGQMKCMLLKTANVFFLQLTVLNFVCLSFQIMIDNQNLINKNNDNNNNKIIS